MFCEFPFSLLWVGSSWEIRIKNHNLVFENCLKQQTKSFWLKMNPILYKTSQCIEINYQKQFFGRKQDVLHNRIRKKLGENPLRLISLIYIPRKIEWEFFMLLFCKAIKKLKNFFFCAQCSFVEGIFLIELFPFPNFLFSTTPQLFNFPKRRFTLNLTLFYFKVFVYSSLAYSHSNFFVITFWKHKELGKEKFFASKNFFLVSSVSAESANNFGMQVKIFSFLCFRD